MLKHSVTYLVALLFMLSGVSFAQNAQQVEDSVNHYLNQIATDSDPDKQLKAHDNLQQLLSRSLRKPEIFHYSFSGVTRMAILGNPETGLRIWSWHVPLRNEAPRYGCVIAQFNPRKDMVEVHRLQQDLEEHYRDRATYATDNWPGALYYEMVPIGRRTPEYYLLFGYDSHDNLSNKKMVDVLHFSGSRPRLGKSVFVKEGKSLHRLIFEYREEAVFSVGYYPEMDMIVFNDLGPTHPSLEGKFAHYVPLRGFSGYERQNARWVFKSEVDFMRERDERDKQFIDPKDADMNRQRSKMNPLTGDQ